MMLSGFRLTTKTIQEAIAGAEVDIDRKPGAGLAGVDDVALDPAEIDDVPVDGQPILGLGRPENLLGQRDRVGEESIAFLQVAAGLALRGDASVQALDEVLVAHEHRIHLLHVLARAKQLDRFVQLLGDADLAGEPVPGAARQDAHRHARADDGVGKLMLGAVAAVADHQVHAAGDRIPGLLGGVAVALGDADIPVDAMLAKHVIQRVQDRPVGAEAGLMMTWTFG